MKKENPAATVRTQEHMPFASPDDAGNLAKYFMDRYLTSCRAVTAEEVVMCLDVMAGVAADVKAFVTGEKQPEHAHHHEETPVMLDSQHVAGEKIIEPAQ